jgi:hypothetical protein
MKQFFPKSNFAVCLELFADIIVQLSALDIAHFEAQIAPVFLELKAEDPRLTAFLRAVERINDPLFIELSWCKATADQVNSLNGVVRRGLARFLPTVEAFADAQLPILLPRFIAYNSIIDHADSVTAEFLFRNRIDFLKPTFTMASNVPIARELSFVQCVLLPLVRGAPINTLAEAKIPQLLIRLATAQDREVSLAAYSAYEMLIGTKELKELWISQTIDFLKTETSAERIAFGLAIILDALDASTSGNFSRPFFDRLETAVFAALLNDSPIVRIHAFQILKNLSAMGVGQSFTILHANSELISSSINRWLMVSRKLAKPSLVIQPVGTLSFELVYRSRYTGLWLFAFASLLEVLVENIDPSFFLKIRSYLGDEVRSARSWFVLYIDSYITELPPLSEGAEQQEVPTIPDMPILRAVAGREDKELIRAMLGSFSMIHWRLVPLVWAVLLSRDSEFLPEIAATLSALLQNPVAFTYLIGWLYADLMEFLIRLQGFFFQEGINNPREIKWSPERLQLLAKYEDLVVNYCILVSIAFNNFSGQVDQTSLPVTARQILVQVLAHWCDLPPSHERISSYAMNALIQVVQSGTVFTPEHVLDESFLELMLKCQLSGNGVLDSLLIYQIDLFLASFCKEGLTRPGGEAKFFLSAILRMLETVGSKETLEAHVGALLLVALGLAPDQGKQVVSKIASLFVDPAQQAETVIENSTDFAYVPRLFEFAAEQTIEAGLNILKNCRVGSDCRAIIARLSPWFAKVRLLPKSAYILPRIPANFRRFTPIKFLDTMFEVMKTLNHEQQELFVCLWSELVNNDDKTSVVLVCIFECEDTSLKATIFHQLIDYAPARVSKFLAKRCSFAYWYFRMTQSDKEPPQITWAIKVLGSAVAQFLDISTPHLPLLLHYSLLYIEEAKSLFVDLISLFDVDYVDPLSVWAGEGVSTVSVAVTLFEGVFQEQRPEAISAWADEAVRWAVGCSDIHLAYRSLAILRSLGVPIPSPSFLPLLAESIAYHLRRNAGIDSLSLFFGECLCYLNAHIEEPSVAPFAFQVVSAVLHARRFNDSCLEAALPIVLYCADLPDLGAQGRGLLVNAFIPFMGRLETDAEVQKLMLRICELTDSPGLWLVAAAFQDKRLPFVGLTRTSEEISAAPVSPVDAMLALQLFSVLAPSITRPLLEALMVRALEFLTKFDKLIDWTTAIPLFRAARESVSFLKPAIKLLAWLFKRAPDASICSEPPERKAKVDVVYGECADKIASLIGEDREVVPMTTCKQLPHLRGMIDQRSPPTIYPYATQFQMYRGLKESVWARQKPGRTGAVGSRGPEISPIRSLIWPTGKGIAGLNLSVLPKRPLVKEVLESGDGLVQTHYVLSPAEFANLASK